jgi:alkylation response protein AidB-like acyl-CoA dehydrogenase
MSDVRTRGSEIALVNDRVDELLEKYDPADTGPREFWGAQFDCGLAWVDFPEGRGGLGVDRSLQGIANDRLRAAGAQDNVPLNLIGLSMMGPTLMQYGTDEQKDRFLRPAFACEEIWCQLFSEPGAGSDLASLATRATADGGDWLVNGQKVWTTLAHKAHFGLLLARTDPTMPKHQGLSFFIVDMHAAGVDVRPLRQITGEAEFNEVFLSDVRVPDSMRLGAVGEGWRITRTNLINERAGVSRFDLGARGSGPIKHALDCWHSASPAQRTAVNRDRLIELWGEAELLRLTRLRYGEEGRELGPETSAIKVLMCTLAQRIYDLCMNLRGPEALLIEDYDETRPDRIALTSSDNHSDLTKAYLSYQAMTIGGGTVEINKTVIGEALLGLAGEPSADKGVPWKDVRRS